MIKNNHDNSHQHPQPHRLNMTLMIIQNMIIIIFRIIIRIAKLLEVAPGEESDDWGEDVSTDHNLYQVNLENDDDDLIII